MKSLRSLLSNDIKEAVRDTCYSIVDFLSEDLTNRRYFGMKVYYHKGNSLIRRIRFFSKIKVYEPALLNTLKRYTTVKNPVFIDIGANIGLISIAYYSIFRECRIVAFEPGPIQRFSFGSTILSNNLFKNIILCDIALSDDCGYASFVTHGAIHNSGDGLKETNRSPDKGIEIVVRVDKLDNQVKAHKIDRLDIIKIDVEGAEMFVLRGALESIAKYKPIIVLEISSKNLSAYNLTCADMLKFIEEINYSLFTLNEESITTINQLLNASLVDDMFLIKPNVEGKRGRD